jgi:two-component system phosphate regulon sensor histidine kinase PhoR
VRARLFWKLGLTYLGLLLVILVAVGLYSSYVLRRDYIRAADSHLASLLALAEARPPAFDDPTELTRWADWIARSGARVTVIDSAGNVLADSSHNGGTADHLAQPEVQQALTVGSASSIRRSAALGSILVYHAAKYQPASGLPLVIRLAVPLSEIDASAAELQRKVLSASLVILLIGGVISLAYFRRLAGRIERLTHFAHQIAEGDFRPLPGDATRDELSPLASALNETAARMDRSFRSLTGERNRSAAILRSMVEGVAVVDAQERLVFSNRAFSESLNLSAAKIEGRPVIEVVRSSELIGLIRRALQGEEGLRADISVGIIQQLTFSVSVAPVLALETPAPSEAVPAPTAAGVPITGKPSGAVVVLHDVTELRRLERVRQDFVANVSHEFKTPLTAIQGFAETLLGGALEDPDHNRRFLEIIRDHAERLAALTNDLLKLARIEAGQLEVDLGPVNLLEVVERCAEVTLLKASQKQIALETDVPPGLPPVRGDASLLREVIQNLLDNAVQYTPAGGRIKVTAAAGPREATISVEDTGIGIPLADQERIFERFYRVDAGRSREAGGTGLGLSIAKHIVEVHGGHLRVESEVGHGSKFSFSLALAA